jgi:hypothetical protein
MSEYGKKEKILDAITCVAASGVMFVMIWIAFAMDVITTGM